MLFASPRLSSTEMRIFAAFTIFLYLCNTLTIAVSSTSAQIKLGCAHACMLRQSGDVSCWGDNTFGQCLYPRSGRGRVTPSTWHEALEVGPIDIPEAVESLSLGCHHTCVLRRDKHVQCFGLARHGQLGLVVDFNSTNQLTYIQNAIAIHADSFQTCIETGTGPVCWGVASTTDRIVVSRNVSYLPTVSAASSSSAVASTTVAPSQAADNDTSPRVLKLATGSHHTCVIVEGGFVKCFGLGTSGQLGNVGISSVDNPESVPYLVLPEPAIDITAGWQHTCAILASRNMICWGWNGHGELGYGDYQARPNAATVSTLTIPAVVSASAGMQHTCALVAIGRAQCWGSNYRGQLGFNGTGLHPAAHFVPRLNLSNNAISIHAGPYHTCAVLATFSVECWGQLIDNRGASLVIPQTPIMLSEKILRIHAGMLTICAVLQGSVARCWGSNCTGLLGVGDDNTARYVAPADMPNLPFNKQIASIVSGISHACALFADDGSVACWGDNANGQVGVTGVSNQWLPSNASISALNASGIAAGKDFTCALKADRRIVCWGKNEYGQLGFNGSSTETHVTNMPSVRLGIVTLPAFSTPSPSVTIALTSPVTPASTSTSTSTPSVSTPATASMSGTPSATVSPSSEPMAGQAYRINSVATGKEHTCVLIRSVGVKCWGNSNRGQLGYGAASYNQSWAAPLLDIQDVIAVAAGDYHTCALLFNGTMKCWGANERGQLGDGSLTDINTVSSLAALPLSDDIKQVSLGARHTCILESMGLVKCWGDNRSGQLGNGNNGEIIYADSAFAVELDDVALQVVCGATHTCAILESDVVNCWGSNDFGQLGISNEITLSHHPVIAGINSVFKLALGTNFSCALLANNNFTCWGTNALGQLGRPGVINIDNPISYPELSRFKTILDLQAGHAHVCLVVAVHFDVVCWGSNEHSQLGADVGIMQGNAFSAWDLPLAAGSLALGYAHSCAVRTSGALICWGGNNAFQLGTGTTQQQRNAAEAPNMVLLPLTPSSPTPAATASISPTQTSSINPTPSAAPSYGRVTMLATGWSHSCVVVENVSMACWGTNNMGQCGYDSTQQEILLPITEYINITGPIQSIAVGEYHTCVVSHFRVKCWGRDHAGQLGYGTLMPFRNIVSVNFHAFTNDIVQVACGIQHTCVVAKGGEVYCWGSGFDGQLGSGFENAAQYRAALAPVTSLPSEALAVTTFALHTCALLANRSVACWGSNEHGQLGIGNFTSHSTPLLPHSLTGVSAQQVVAGVHHTCVLLSQGSVSCWGFPANGLLGRNYTADVPAPDLNTLMHINATRISAAATHSCIITNTSDLKCWGSNSYRQVGFPDAAEISYAETVPSVMSGVSDVGCGFQHTCAVLLDGRIKCWGSNSQAQLGHPTGTHFAASMAVPVAFPLPPHLASPTTTPSASPSANYVPGLTQTDLRVTKLVANSDNTCVLIAVGYIKCWGLNDRGQLGYGDTSVGLNASARPFIQLDQPIVDIALGELHACAIVQNGSIVCWGDGLSGCLGNGDTESVSSPHVRGYLNLSTSVRSVAAGLAHTCVVNASASSVFLCWGSNGYGQLGHTHGIEISSASLARGIVVPAHIEGLSAGTYHTCALTSSGLVYCWGSNSHGQLGDGTQDTVIGFSSQSVSLPKPALSVRAGAFYTCATLNDGTISCWGDNLYGQIGHNSENPFQLTPATLSFNTTVATVCAGRTHTCVIMQDTFAVSCWGDRGLTGIGLGNGAHILSAINATVFPLNATQIGLGAAHTCILDPQSNVKCWGLNENGQLGITSSDIELALDAAVVEYQTPH